MKGFETKKQQIILESLVWQMGHYAVTSITQALVHSTV